MVKRFSDLQTWHAITSDGVEVGRITDLYVDDDRWVVRYLIITEPGWLTSAPLPLSPALIQRVEAGASRVLLNATDARSGALPI